MTIEKILQANQELLELLEIIRSFQLPDCWLCAGCIRNYIWDYLSDNKQTASLQHSDIDVVFFDPTISYNQTLALERKIKQQYPQYNWEIKNQCYMHIHSPNTNAYLSATDAIAKFPEKCTAIAARLNTNHSLELFIPYGVEDLFNFVVAPTPYFLADTNRRKLYNQRVKKKNWQQTWPNLTIVYCPL